MRLFHVLTGSYRSKSRLNSEVTMPIYSISKIVWFFIAHRELQFFNICGPSAAASSAAAEGPADV